MIKIETGTKCVCCGNNEAYIAIGKQGGNFTFSDLISSQVCWQCYVAVVSPVDRKLANAKARISKGFPAGLCGWDTMQRATRAYLKDKRNIEAWEEAINSKRIQRQLYGIE